MTEGTENYVPNIVTDKLFKKISKLYKISIKMSASLEWTYSPDSSTIFFFL